jgi:hypothetical protein
MLLLKLVLVKVVVNSVGLELMNAGVLLENETAEEDLLRPSGALDDPSTYVLPVENNV